MDIIKTPAHEIAALIAKKEITAKETAEIFLKRAKRDGEKYGAFISLNEKGLLEEAKAVDLSLANGNALSPLAGVPVAVKDNICTKGIETTCASKILKGFVPPYNATVVDKLKKAGLPLIGKCNMDEFAFGSSTETSFFGPAKNPWDTLRAPGGSSGGSAAAVSACLSPLSLGSDTGGSIRLPASFCGVCGLKPTYGRVSRYGLIAFASSLDQIGPFANNVTDAAFLYDIIAGHDERDSTSAPVDNNSVMNTLNSGIKGLRIGVPAEYFVEGIDPDIAQSIKDAIVLAKDMGAVTVDISLPHTEYANASYYILAPAEASSNLARFDGVQYGFRHPDAGNMVEMYIKSRAEGFGAEAKRRIMLGTYCLSAGYYDAYYLKAQKARTLIKADFEEAFKKVDVILTPVSPTPAFALGERVNDPLKMYLTDIFTISVNLAGLPAMSLPIGLSKNSLPIGLQIIGNFYGEADIFRTARALEREADFGRLKEDVLYKKESF